MKNKHVYGPVPSRRLGLSLGIDLVPFKYCTFDCIYCQIGKTTHKIIERKEYIPAEDILEEATRIFDKNPHADFVTFSGSGEPTLHSRIGYLIQQVKAMTKIPVAVLTNGSLFFIKDVRRDIAPADVVLPTLCAVSENVFRNINRSDPAIHIDNVINGLIELRRMYTGKIWLEIMLVKNFNDSKSEILKLKEKIKAINPDKIHLNTVVRPPSEEKAVPLSHEDLKKIQVILGNKCEIVADFKNRTVSVHDAKTVRDIQDMIRRRPITLQDIMDATGLHQLVVIKHLEYLQSHNKITSSQHGDRTYYEAVQEEDS